MNKRSIIICLATLAVICVHAFSQWQPIEDISIPKEAKGGWRLLFYDRDADYIGFISGWISWSNGRIDVHVYDLEESEWEYVDSIFSKYISIFLKENGLTPWEVHSLYLQAYHRLYLLIVWQRYLGDEDGPQYINIWELKKEGWSNIDLAGAFNGKYKPLAREDFSVAISTDGRIMLHGGCRWGFPGSNYFEKTWIFHFDKWRLVEGDGPGHLQGAALTYDEKNKNFVLFGGQTRNRKGNRQTWVFDERWKKRSVNKRPSRRRHPDMFYSNRMEKVVLYGGLHVTARGKYADDLSDIWTWDGKKWELYDDDTKVNGEVIKGSITYDSRRNRMIALYKNKFWEYKFDKKVK